MLDGRPRRSTRDRGTHAQALERLTADADPDDRAPAVDRGGRRLVVVVDEGEVVQVGPPDSSRARIYAQL